MITRDEQTNLIEQAMASRSWDINKHKLAKSFRISVANAESQLLSAFYTNRVEHYKEVPTYDKLERDITFARKEIERNQWKSDKQYFDNCVEPTDELFDEIADDSDFVYIEPEEMPHIQGFTDEQVMQVIDFADELFQKRTAPFVKMLLIYGEFETKRLTLLTDKQFKRKMDSVVAYIKKNEDKFMKALNIQPVDTGRKSVTPSNPEADKPYYMQDPMTVSFAGEPNTQPVNQAKLIGMLLTLSKQEAITV